MSGSVFSSVALRGIVSAVPQNVVSNTDFRDVYSDSDIEKTANMSGVAERRYAGEKTCTSDLCVAAARKLMQDLNWDPQSIDCVLFVTQTPDYKLPATSCVMAESLGVPKHCAALDISLGCSGYVYGLWLASCMVESGARKRVLLLVGDTCTKFVSKKDKSTAMLFGDAGTATAIEYQTQSPTMTFVLGTDGSGAPNLIIPGGGFREQSSAETLVESKLPDGSLRSREHLYMNGAEIFNFTISAVPKLIKEVLHQARLDDAGVNSYIFHQANLFMINHIAKKLKISPDKVPTSIAKFGNTSSASIPLTLCIPENSTKKGVVILAGFGVGYSWAACALTLDENVPCDILEFGGGDAS